METKYRLELCVVIRNKLGRVLALETCDKGLVLERLLKLVTVEWP